MLRSRLLGALAGALVAVSLPHTCANNQVADASAVNANFTTLAGAVDAQATRLDAVEAGPWVKGTGARSPTKEATSGSALRARRRSST